MDASANLSDKADDARMHPPPSAPEVENARMRSEGENEITKVRANLGPEPIALLLRDGSTILSRFEGWPPPRLFQFLRCRLGLTQHQVARLAGLAPSQITRLEGGRECLLSTWTRAYAALGCEAALVPGSKRELEELQKELGLSSMQPKLRPHGPWFRSR